MAQNPFQIDNARLDDEWRRQPGLSREAGRREADAKHAHAQARARLAVTAARMSLAIRKAPEKFGLRERPNNDEVAAALEVSPEYQDAVREVDEAKLAEDYAKADTVAFVDRRKALENLVELLRLDYFAEQEPRPLSAETRRRMTDPRTERFDQRGDDDG